MGELNSNQARRVIATFTHVDGLLSKAERMTGAEFSPFSPESADVAADEAGMVAAFVSQARARMLAALDHLGIPRPRRSISGNWSARTSLMFADIALSELRPEDLAGYGNVDAEAALELSALASDLRAILGRASRVLEPQHSGRLAAQLQAIDGPPGEILRVIEAVSRKHSLAEIRPLLTAAVERTLSTTFDVGVFGRVSAGKSSLINALVGTPVLPVGAVPVTSVPIRLANGPEHVVIRFLDGASRNISLDELPEFGTEEHNPSNRAGVSAIEITVPGVSAGLRLLDTPGVGSISATGPAAAFAWLPRCDLGLVLIAAGTPVGRDDLALINGLCQAGIRCIVLLSKSDVLSSSEKAAALAYVQREVRAAVGAIGGDTTNASEVMIRAVSTSPAFLSALDEFRTEIVDPLIQNYARSARAALVVRLHRLVNATAASLNSRLMENSSGELSDIGTEKLVAIEASRRFVAEVTTILSNASSAVLEQAADALVAAWANKQEAGDAVRNTIVRTIGESLGNVRQRVDEVRTSTGVALSHRRMPPIFDPEFLDSLPEFEAPSFAPGLRSHGAAARQLEALTEPVQDALARYSMRLSDWAGGALDEIAAELADVAISSTKAVAALPEELDSLTAALAALDVVSVEAPSRHA